MSYRDFVRSAWSDLIRVLGEPLEHDISPVSGSVFFVSHEIRQVLTINVLPDDVPEGIEVGLFKYLFFSLNLLNLLLS